MLALLLSLILSCSNTECEPEVYGLTTIVREIDYTSNTVVCEDCNGEIWCFFETDDWEVNDICTLTMYNNNTREIYDDFIVDYRYSGTIDMFIY